MHAEVGEQAVAGFVSEFIVARTGMVNVRERTKSVGRTPTERTEARGGGGVVYRAKLDPEGKGDLMMLVVS